MTKMVSPKRVALAGRRPLFRRCRVRVVRSTSSFAGKKPGTGHRRGQLSGGGRNRRRKPGNNFRTSFAPSDEDPGAGSIYAFDHATPHYVHDRHGRWEPGDLAGREGVAPSLAGAYSPNLKTAFIALVKYSDWFGSHPNPNLVQEFRAQTSNMYGPQVYLMQDNGRSRVGIYHPDPTQVDFLKVVKNRPG